MRLPLVKLVHAMMVGSLLIGLSANSVVKSEASPAEKFPFARVENTCAPTDGPAFQLYFTKERVECGAAVKEPFLAITVYESLPGAPQTYSFRYGDRTANAARCLRAGARESAASGTLRLTEIQAGKDVSGDYELHFEDGSVAKARFHARRCFVKMFCG